MLHSEILIIEMIYPTPKKKFARRGSKDKRLTSYYLLDVRISSMLVLKIEDFQLQKTYYI